LNEFEKAEVRRIAPPVRTEANVPIGRIGEALGYLDGPIRRFCRSLL
jgi:hypothetical protein